MTSIAETVRGLKSLSVEIKTRALELKNLRKKKKEFEDVITKYLIDKDQPGIKCDNFIVLSKSKECRLRKKKADKLKDGTSVLTKHGVDDPEKVLNEILESMRGDKSVVSCLKTQEMK
jgi:hypothetical protein